MSASRRAQVQALCRVRSGPLIDRVESHMAAVDVWSKRGNAKAVKNAGTGVVAVCCLLAAESLDLPEPERSSAIRASGLTPEKFGAAERDFRAAIQSVSRTSTTQAGNVVGPSQGSAFAAAHRTTAALSASRPLKSSPLASKAGARTGQESLLAKAQAVQAGTAFDNTMRAPLVQPTVTTDASRTLASTSADSATRDDVPPRQEPISRSPRLAKRKRMSRLVFGLDTQSNKGRLNESAEATLHQSRQLQIRQIQATVDRLRGTEGLECRYESFPLDFCFSISSKAT